MATSRQCRSCRAALADDNRSGLCNACQRAAAGALFAPPVVPPDFWESPGLATALAAQHMGKVCRAYRLHPFHRLLHGHQGLTQTTIAGWLGISQAHVSRAETGPPDRNLDSLAHWALTLRIPAAHLWFDLPAKRRDGSAGELGQVSVQEADPAVAASQNEWRRVRRYLNSHRSTLARRAAGLYQPSHQLGDTALLTCPEWLPSEPVELSAIELAWREGPQAVTIDGSEPEAQPQAPLRATHRRFERYTTAIRYVDAPSLFENRPSYRMLDVSWSNLAGRMTFGLATYFDKLDVAEAIGHELAKGAALPPGPEPDAFVPSWADLPFRRLIGDPFNLGTRAVVPAVTTLTLIRKERGSADFLLHWRDPARVATAGGTYDVIPAGEFQPSSVMPWTHVDDLNIWRNMVREYSEELCGMPEHDGSSGTPLDYDRWPFFRAMTEARRSGRIAAYCLGVGLDALTLAATIPTVVVIQEDAFREIFGEVVRVNAEGHTVTSLKGQGSATGIPFTEANVQSILEDAPMVPPGAACIYLSWEHRHTLLADASNESER